MIMVHSCNQCLFLLQVTVTLTDNSVNDNSASDRLIEILHYDLKNKLVLEEYVVVRNLGKK